MSSIGACDTLVTEACPPCSSLDIPRDTNALCERVMQASPGEAILYHLGMLARDRERHISELPEQERIDLDAVADYAWRLADAGWCHLLQRRAALECFAYLVVMRPRPRQQRAMPTPRPMVRRVHGAGLTLLLAESA
jgi:hypothetical protein